jgi:hypothetical protein
VHQTKSNDNNEFKKLWIIRKQIKKQEIIRSVTLVDPIVTEEVIKELEEQNHD